jgi:uncharacterized protein (DUF1501 family)
MTMDRRDFMKLAGLCGLSVAVPFKARAQESILYEGNFFVQVNAGGGWDPTSFCDPKGALNQDEMDNGNPMNRSYFTDDIEVAGNIPYAPVGSNANFFQNYQNELLVINGIDTQTNGHDSGARHTWSGKLAEGHPAWGALVAAAKSRLSPMAFLSNGGFDLTQGLVAPTRSGNTNVLQRIAFPHRMDTNNEESLFHTQNTIDRIATAQRERLEAAQTQNRLQRIKSAMSTLYTARIGENEVQRLTDFLPDQLDNSGNRLFRQAQLALASYAAGLTVSANLSVGGFDTHGNHDANHIPRLAQLLDGVDFLMQEAERMGIRDRVVVVVGSDFGRTPGYNGGNGKDHWSITSMMAMGPGITGGRVIGGTDERHRAKNIDPDTFEVVNDGGVRIEPGHVHRELRRIAGIEEDEVVRGYPVNVNSLNLFG